MKPLRWTASRVAVRWVLNQREACRPGARPISAEERARLGPFFAASLLNSVRIARLGDVRVRDPLQGLIQRAQHCYFERTCFTAITYVDTVLVNGDWTKMRGWDAMLFHECVHVVQYGLLGTRGFLRAYVDGWASAGCRYAGIPLEQHAHRLHRRFAADPGAAFSVEAEVRRQLGRQPT